MSRRIPSRWTDIDSADDLPDDRADRRRRRRLRLRRRGRRAYIRSVYFLPSLATLGNAISGFGAIYVASIVGNVGLPASDPIAEFFLAHGLAGASFLIFIAMAFDALDGRLARFARHTTDFGGQLDSLADVVSFGAAPAFIAIRLMKIDGGYHNYDFSRFVWAAGALFMSCAAVRLARFNVSNEHGEQHHFSFLGLPSPGAAGAVAALILMEQALGKDHLIILRNICLGMVPAVLIGCGLLMISHMRYPHLVNRYLRGKRSIGRLILVLAIGLLLLASPQYTLGIGTLAYAVWGPLAWFIFRIRKSIRPNLQPKSEKPA